jgi:hypothetical protein
MAAGLFRHPQQLPPGQRRAALALRTVVALLLVSTSAGLFVALSRPEAFAAAFPGSTGMLYWTQIGTALAGLIALTAIAALRAWAPWLFAGVATLAIALDVATRAPLLHLGAAAVATLVVVALCRACRSAFGGRSGP